MKIKELCAEERPREKLLLRGASALGTAELLAILIGSGTGGRNAVEVAQGLLASADGRLGRLTLQGLRRVRGIGKARAVAIVAALELGRRAFGEQALIDKVSIHDPQAVFRMMQPSLRGIDHEQCWVLYLNRSKRILGKECISVGTDRMAPLDTRRIVRKAIDRQASAIILLHNHPSGNPLPSAGDLTETGRLRNALNLFGIDLLDHIIVADSSFYSFHEESVLQG